jgi:hypothetical protein
MTSIYLAVVGIIQLVVIFLLERTHLLRHLTELIFLDQKNEYPSIKNEFGDVTGSHEADRTADVLRITDLISALFASAVGLLVGAIINITVGVIGTRTRQKLGWPVDGSYVAGGICVAFLIVMLIMILKKEVQDHAKWEKDPGDRWKKDRAKKLARAIRNGLSLRTPTSYRLIVLVTSCYLILATGLYQNVTPVGH